MEMNEGLSKYYYMSTVRTQPKQIFASIPDLVSSPFLLFIVFPSTGSSSFTKVVVS